MNAVTLSILASHRRVAILMLAAGVLWPPGVSSQSRPVVPSGVGTIRGAVFDSVHNTPLAGAIVLIDGFARVGQTGADGRYMIDSIPPGSYRLNVSHPLLDTIGLAVMTNSLPLRPGETITLDFSLPSSGHIVSLVCPAGGASARGPAALIGQVVDPESDKPAVGSRVQLLYDEKNLFGLRVPTVREALVDSAGNYRICGLPSPVSGKLQVFRNGVSSGQVDVQIDQGTLGLRSISIMAARVAATITDSAGLTKQVYVGSARLTGRVMSKAGQPVAGARVSVMGSGFAMLTRARGDFAFDSLAAGTQSLEVRKLGFGATDKSVELSSSATTSVTVTMNDYELPAVRVDAERDKVLSDLGYADRKKAGFGFFLDGDKIRPQAPLFSEVVRGAPMLKISPGAKGNNIITSARDPNYGCVNFIVDGARWKELSPGDIDDYLRPGELSAIEVYNPSSAPPRFESPGSTKCATVVIWTVRSTNRPRKK